MDLWRLTKITEGNTIYLIIEFNLSHCSSRKKKSTNILIMKLKKFIFTNNLKIKQNLILINTVKIKKSTK